MPHLPIFPEIPALPPRGIVGASIATGHHDGWGQLLALALAADVLKWRAAKPFPRVVFLTTTREFKRQYKNTLAALNIERTRSVNFIELDRLLSVPIVRENLFSILDHLAMGNHRRQRLLVILDDATTTLPGGAQAENIAAFNALHANALHNGDLWLLLRSGNNPSPFTEAIPVEAVPTAVEISGLFYFTTTSRASAVTAHMGPPRRNADGKVDILVPSFADFWSIAYRPAGASAPSLSGGFPRKTQTIIDDAIAQLGVFPLP